VESIYVITLFSEFHKSLSWVSTNRENKHKRSDGVHICVNCLHVSCGTFNEELSKFDLYIISESVQEFLRSKCLENNELLERSKISIPVKRQICFVRVFTCSPFLPNIKIISNGIANSSIAFTDIAFGTIE